MESSHSQELDKELPSGTDEAVASFWHGCRRQIVPLYNGYIFEFSLAGAIGITGQHVSVHKCNHHQMRQFKANELLCVLAPFAQSVVQKISFAEYPSLARKTNGCILVFLTPD